VSETERAEFIKHIIKTDSERRFLRDLERYLAQADNCFQQFDWWAFSKIDESLDEVYLWYYDPNSNRMAKFKPDFIFWLQKGNDYWIVFVDPKGTEHLDWQRKLEGYRQLFEQDDTPKEFRYNDLTARVLLLFYTADRNLIPADAQRGYWFDRVEQLTERIRQP